MSIFQYTQIRESLIDLANEFDEFFRYCDFLNHELLYAPEGVGEERDTWSTENFDLVKQSISSFPSWQCFALSSERVQCSRFWSWDDCGWAIPTFLQLCERGWQLLLAASRESTSEMPKRYCVDAMQPRTGVSDADEWLALLHEMAFRFPTVNLHGDCRWRTFGGTQCVSNVLSIDIVSGSARLIDLIVASDYVAEIRSWECKLELELPAEHHVPKWNSELGNLWFDGAFIKSFSINAGNQRIVLDAFEEQGWPELISMPRCVPNSAKPIFADKTITDLNRGLQNAHSRIRFGRIQNGEFLTWFVSE